MKQFSLFLSCAALFTINSYAQVTAPVSDSTVVENLIVQSTINLNPPLYIFDNVEITDQEFRKIDETKLESICVIKDSAMLAKYGTKGERGVVVITSRKPPMKIKDAVKTVD